MATINDQTTLSSAKLTTSDDEVLFETVVSMTRRMKSVLDKMDVLIHEFENLGGASVDCYRKVYRKIVYQKELVYFTFEAYENSVSEYEAIKKVKMTFQSSEMSFIQNIAEKIPIIGPVLAKSMPAIGNIASNIFGEFMHDTPPLKMSEGSNLALVDIPREVSSFAVSANDVLPTQERLLDMDIEQMIKMTDIIERAKIPSRIATINWPQTAVAGTQLYSENVNTQFQTPTTGSGNTYLEFNHPIAYFSQMFLYWRGGFRVTIECLPTRFHQGQLYAAFNPSLAATTLNGVRNCTAVTIDLGMNNRTSLDIPFVSQTDYLSCLPFTVPATPATLLNSLGTFTIFVQNELDSNGTVATSIDINVYVEALPDFELKVFRPIPTTSGVQVYTGTWQMNEEVVQNVRVAGPTQHEDKTKNESEHNVAICSNVVSISTESILQREYLMDYGQTFATSNNVGDLVYNKSLPDGFFSSDFATSGVLQYHELYRMNFKVTIKINPTQFHQGALIMYWAPLNIDMRAGKALGTLTQLPHAILNIANETECSVIVPYSSMTRVLRSQYPSMGNICVMVWNALRCPTAAPQSVKFSGWIQALDVHMAVKRQAGTEVTLQSGEAPSDTATGETTTQIAYKKATTDKPGFIVTKHDNVLSMMRRYTCVNYGQINISAPLTFNSWNLLWKIPAFCGREHYNILNTYLASSGSNRLNIISNFGMAENVLAMAHPNYIDTVQPAIQPPISGPALENPFTVFRGAVLWHPGIQQQKVVEVPYYRMYPMIANNQSAESYNTGWPTVDISYVWSPTTSTPANVPVSMINHAVGDDFMVYFPIVIPRMRIQSTSLVTADFVNLNKNTDAHGSVVPRVANKQSQPPGIPVNFQMLSNFKKSVKEVVNIGDTIKANRECAKSLKDTADAVGGVLRDSPASVVLAACDSNSKVSEFWNKWMKISELLTDCVLNVAHICKGGPIAVIAIANLTTKLGRFAKPYIWDKLIKLSEVTLQGKEKGSITSWFPQWNQIFKDLAPSITAVALSILSYEFTGADNISFRIRFDEAMDGKISLLDKCMALFQVIIDYIFEGTGFFVDWYKYSHAEITQLVSDFNSDNSEGKFDSDKIQESGNKEKLDKYYKKALRISKYAPAIPKFPVQYTKLAEAIIKTYKSVKIPAEASRCVPIAAAFMGKSGVGKSLLIGTVLPIILLLKTKLCESASQAQFSTWARPTGQNVHFFDGYTGQKVMYVDDFLKEIEAKDASDMINLISCTQTPLEMAKLEEKGRLFSSKFILATTNSSNFASVHGLMHPEALCTRFKNAWTITTKNQDGAKAASWLANNLEGKTIEQLIDMIDQEWHFFYTDVSGGHIRSSVTFRSIVTHLVDDYHNKQNIHTKLTSALSTITLQAGESEYYDVEDYSREDAIRDCMANIRASRIDGDYAEYKEMFISELKCLGIYKLKNEKNWENETLTAQEMYYLLEPDVESVINKEKCWKGLCYAVFGIATVSMLGVAAVGVYKLIKSIIQMFISGVKAAFQGQAYDNTPRHKSKPVGVVLQNDEDKLRKLRRNIRVIRIVDIEDESIMCSMYCLTFESKFIIVNRHFVDSWRRKRSSGMNVNIEIELITSVGDTLRMEKVAINESMIKDIKNDQGTSCDLCLVYLSNANINGAGKISQFIPTRNEFIQMMKGKDIEAAILGNEKQDDIDVITKMRYELLTADGDDMTMILSTFCEGITKSGDCGRPYYFNNNVSKPLYAMHSALANGTKRAGATPLILDDIMEAYNAFKTSELPIEEEINFQCNGKISKYWNTPIENLGEVSINGIKLNTVLIDKTDKRKWLEHDEWPNKYAPSYKGITDDFHAMYSNAQKCIPKYTHVVEPRMHELCVQQYIQQFPQERDKHLLTEFEIINGYDTMNRLVMSTSSGILSKWFSNGKYDFFDKIDDVNYAFSNKAKTFIIPIHGQTFVKRLSDLEDNLKMGVIKNSPLWVATVKDELRKIEKVKQGKTRIFEQPSLEYTMLVRKYFGSFLNYIRKNPGFVTHSAIGIDYEVAWKSIFDYLRSKGKYGFDVDYTNYDGSVSPQAFEFYRRITDEYYGDRSPVRHGLLYILQNSYVLVGFNLMKTELGNKSGNPMTDVFNSITNVYILYASYLNGRISVGLSPDFTDFHRDVALLTYGDDVIISADCNTLKYFNRQSVSETTTKLGFIATSADKSGNLQKFENLLDLQFLKSKFVPLDWCVLAPKPIEIAIRELQFISKQNKGDKRIKKDLFENAMRFAAHSGKNEIERLQRQCADRGHNLRFDFEDFIQDIIDKQRVCGVQTPTIY